MCRNYWLISDSCRKWWLVKGCQLGVTGFQEWRREAGDIVRLGIGMVDPVRFIGGFKALVHFGVFVRTSCGEEMICVSPSVFYRIRSKDAR